ncbi:MAG: glycine betaine ABC transporter substrate-binding protein [Pseudomonadota bacterium]
MRGFLLLFAFCFPLAVGAAERPITVASKNFNESYLLAEIMSQLLEIEGFAVERRYGLGGTLVCYEALVSGEIDVYAEYTGTLGQAILKIDDPAPSVERLNSLLVDQDLLVLDSLGFNNTYAMAIKAGLARDLGIARVSDLVDQSLRFAFSLEFLNREDGWPGLKRTYGFSVDPIGIEHGLAYQAIDEGKIDITDAYSTDGDLERYQLTTLVDDRNYFPQYFAVPFVRADMPVDAREVLGRLAGRITDDRMRELNGRIVVEGQTFAEVAQSFLREEGFGTSVIDDNIFWQNLLGNTATHLKLTGIALALGILFGVPIGVLVYRSRSVSRVMVYIAGLMQTIPSIALLALMIPLFGIGTLPAIVALFLYSILPILRNTITALISIDPLLKRIAEAIGLTRWQQLWYVLIPMALPNMLAGIKTAAIISIGTATLAAFIGAGGLGEPIVTGLALNDSNLILQGAIPAAILAILVELLFELLERVLVKPHMLSGQLPE